MPTGRSTDGSRLDERVRLRTVATIAVTVLGVLAILFGLTVYTPYIALSLGLSGIAVGAGGAYLRRTLSPGERNEERDRVPSAETSGDLGPDADPVSILKTRYARGDVDDEEFERRVTRLLDLESIDDGGAEREDELARSRR